MTSWTWLAFNAVGLAVAIMALWLYAVRIRDVSFIDAFWAFGMVLLAGITAIVTQGSEPAALLLLSLVSLWGCRLGWHLYSRWRASGVDPRYAAILGRAMDKKGWSFAKASLLLVFLLQAPLLFLVCLPAQVGIAAATDQPIGWQACLGAVIALTGIGFESIGDAQLKAFRADPANKGKVLDTGLWRYTRHPNYFGDACTWWGIWIIAATAPAALWTLPCPILLTWLLTRWSGVPILEKGLGKSRPGYAAYVARTSAFLPLPPKA